MKNKKDNNTYSALHAHDYSTIEYNNDTFIEIANCEEDPIEAQKVVDKVEYITKLLNENQH